jgi:PAS domain S-box-containing protein
MTQDTPVKQINVLLVDDSAGDRRLVMLALSRSANVVEFNVQTAETLDQARTRLAAGRPDIILLDLGLPDSNGLETVLKMKEAAPTEPIIVLTGLMDEEMGLQTIKKGAEDYVVKGRFTDDSLTRTIRYVIERKKANEAVKDAQQRFEVVIEKAPFIAVKGCDRSGQILHWNPAAETMFGHSKAEALKMKIQDFFADTASVSDFENIVNSIWETHQVPPPREWAIKTTSGKSLTVFSSMFPIISQGKCIEIFCMHVDITQRKMAEDQLKKANEQLKEQDRMKSDFVMTVTHELRTPLTIFKNVISNALAGAMGKLTDKLRQNLIMADEAVDRLASIVSDFFDISKLEAGKIKLSPTSFCLCELTGGLTELFRPTVQKRGIHIKTELPGNSLRVEADRGRIAQVINNLISNAVKFVPDKTGQITVRIIDHNEYILAEVEDNGSGIPPDGIGKLFNRFVQVGKHVGPGAHGTGLGLAISKEFITLHDGKIWVENVPGSGAKFSFTLPKVFARVPEKTPENAPEKTPEKASEPVAVG